MSAAGHPSDSSLAVLLMRVAQELRSTGNDLRTVEAAIGRFASEAAERDEAEFQDFQIFDRATQEMENLATFMETLAACVPAFLQGDFRQAFATVRLERLARDLAHGRCDGRLETDPAEQDYESFA